MAEGYNEENSQPPENEVNFLDGHRMQYIVVLEKLSPNVIYLVDRDYTTGCKVSKTKWLFSMKFERVMSNGVVHVPVTLHRYDSKNCLVQALVSVSLSNDFGECFFEPSDFNDSAMRPRNKICNQIDGILESQDQIDLFNDKLIVRVLIEIRKCHTEVTPQKMAHEGSTNVEIYPAFIQDGHEIQTAIYIQDFVERLPWYFTRILSTDCLLYPTTWCLQIKIQQVSITGTLSFFITLRRMDYLNRSVKVSFSVLSYISYLTLIPENTFIRDNILFGQQINAHIEGIALSEELIHLLNDQLLLHVTISVQFCHSSRPIQDLQ